MPLSTTFDRALVFASKLHRHQMRKGTEIPYLTHLLGVCSLVLSYEGNETEAIAGLLHDSLEDGPTYTELTRTQIEAEIQTQFGDRVLNIVSACTDQAADASQKEPWRVRKERYLSHMQATTDAGYLLVTACDKLHNLTSIRQDYAVISDELWSRFTAGKEGSLWYYRELGKVLEQQAALKRVPGALVVEYKNQFQGLPQES